jgi:SNF2 family DNA or RNA helicase
VQIKFSVSDDGIHIKFDYHKKLIEKLKTITGHNFIPESQTWVVPFYELDNLTKILPIPSDIKQLTKDKLEERHKELKNHGFKYELKPFQYDAILFLLERQKAFLCADMGLGKTFMSIALSEILFTSKNISHTVIICPASLKYHWMQEINKLLGEMPIRIIEGDKKKRMKQWKDIGDSRFTILNYELVRLAEDFEELSLLLRNHKSLIILDEASRIKNFEAKTSKGVKKLKAPFKVALSGRPMENKPEELYSINQFLDNSVFGTWPMFDRRYVIRNSYGSVSNYTNLEELHGKVKAIMYRKTKQEVLPELPELSIHNYYVTLTASEALDYAKIINPILEILERREAGEQYTSNGFRNILGTMTIAKMYCDHPDLVKESTSDSAKSVTIKAKTASKFNELMNILQEIGDQKVIIFTQYSKMAYKLYNHLTNFYRCTVITGDQSTNRDLRILEFQNETQILICTEVLGYGVNLQFASVLINYDLPWNPATLEQRNARVHRMGQKNKVNIINLIVQDEDKIEQRIRQVLNSKSDLYKIIVEGKPVEKELVDEDTYEDWSDYTRID